MAANFGSSFAEAFLGTISAMDKHEQAKAEIAEAQRRNRIFDTYETAGNVLNGDDTSGLLDQKSYEKLQKQQAKEQRKAFKGGQKAQAPQMGALPTPQAGMQPTMATAPEPQMGVAPEPMQAAPAPQAAIPTQTTPVTAPTMDPTKQPIVQNPDGTRSTVSTMGFDIDGKYYNLPTISPDGKRLTPDEAVAEFRKTGRHLGVYNSREEGDAAAQALHLNEEKRIDGALPTGKEKVPVDAAKTGPAVKGPDNKEYYKVMVNGQVMYAPADRVKRLSGADLYKAQADALDRIDPVQAAALRKTVIGLEKDTIELNTARMGQSVAQAKAALMNGDYAGFAKSLASAYNTSVPDSMQVSVENDPQAGPVMVRTDVSGKVINKIPLNGIDPETKMRNVDMLMAQAETLTTPNGMTNWLKSVADMRSGVIGDALNLARKEQTELTTKQAKEMFPLEIAHKKAQIAATHRSNRGDGGSTKKDDGRLPGYELKTEVYNDKGDQRNVYMPKHGRGVALVEGPNGEFMPKRYADNPSAYFDAVKAVQAVGGTGYQFDASGDMYAIIPGKQPRRIIHRTKR